MKDLHNMLIYGYAEVNIGRVRNIAHTEAPQLYQQLVDLSRAPRKMKGSKTVRRKSYAMRGRVGRDDPFRDHKRSPQAGVSFPFFYPHEI